MTDLEIVRKCAEKMGYGWQEYSDGTWSARIPRNVGRMGFNRQYWSRYNPLTDDAQAMALVKRLKLSILQSRGEWIVSPKGDFDSIGDPDLNRAICLCVASLP